MRFFPQYFSSRKKGVWVRSVENSASRTFKVNVTIERDGRVLASSLIDAIRKKLADKGEKVSFGIGCTGVFKPRTDNSMPNRWVINQINEEAMFAGGDDLPDGLGSDENFPIFFAEDYTRQRLLELTVISLVGRRK